MKSLVTGVYAEQEGATERRFLPILVRRTLEYCLLQYGATNVDILDPIWVRLHSQPNYLEQRISEAARQCSGYHILMVHADADARTADTAIQERINPGFERARRTGATSPELVEVVPIRSTDAWMLADEIALAVVLGTTMTRNELGLPPHVRDVERDLNPKSTLQQAIKQVEQRSTRRRRIDFESIHSPLAEQIDLNILLQVPAYERYVQQTHAVLIKLGFVRDS